MLRPVTSHNLRQTPARLTSEIAEFGSTLSALGEPSTPQARRHRTTVLRCIHERTTRAIDELMQRPVTPAKGSSRR